MTWLDRVKEEHKELNEKAIRLRIFLVSEACNGLDRPAKSLLRMQLRAMDDYLTALEMRIDLEERRCAKAS